MNEILSPFKHILMDNGHISLQLFARSFHITSLRKAVWMNIMFITVVQWFQFYFSTHIPLLPFISPSISTSALAPALAPARHKSQWLVSLGFPPSTMTPPSYPFLMHLFHYSPHFIVCDLCSIQCISIPFPHPYKITSREIRRNKANQSHFQLYISHSTSNEVQTAWNSSWPCHNPSSFLLNRFHPELCWVEIVFATHKHFLKASMLFITLLRH